jgi:ubiquinone/menaquinone biosynthesis C-methylase UbiE
MADTLTKLTYQTFQQSKNYFALAHKMLSTRLMNMISPAQRQAKPIPTELLLNLQGRLNNLLEIDWQDAERGVYPTTLLFDNPWEDFFRYYPAVWMDLPQVWERVKQKKHQEFSPGIEIDGYPSYYVQNFHHQTDGYLSDFSANLYDLQVEILFGGSVDAMRRRILAPLKAHIEALQTSLNSRQIRILDVACGTGRTLKMIRASLPQVSLFGTDLSPAYLRKANELLSQIPGELPQLLQANAEELPYLDNYFHAVTSVFLFHELPAFARQQIIDESFRVVKPGGVFIICDSIQVSDSPELEPIMDSFPETFHEPYYKNYITDDLVERLKKAGFVNIETQVHFMSKYLIARKPI